MASGLVGNVGGSVKIGAVGVAVAHMLVVKVR